jgi:hypothetical protein
VWLQWIFFFHEYRKLFTFVTDTGEDTVLLFIKCDYSVKAIANDAQEVGEIEKVTVAERGECQ